MAATNTSVATGKVGAYAITLSANTVDTVTFADDLDLVRVVTDGVAAVYVTVDGSTPAVADSGSFELPAVAGATAGKLCVSDVYEVPTGGGTVVKLKSAGTAAYSVSRTPTRQG